MNENVDYPMADLESVRNKIIDSYLNTIEASFRDNKPQIKAINYGTGSGKTHQLFQSMCRTIKEHPDTQVVGIYVAPLREHLSIPDAIRKQYPDIPVYTINSLEMQSQEHNLEFYKKAISSILKNNKFWNIGNAKNLREKVEETKKYLRDAEGAINRLRYFKVANFGDEKLEKKIIDKAQKDLNHNLEKFLEFVVKSKPNESSWLEEVRRLMEIFLPLHLLREKSGIVLLTYKKFETRVPYFKHNEETWILKSDYLDEYIIKHSSDRKKFILALDEQEDGYQIVLEEKIDIISPQDLAINNALSSIYREFSLMFSESDRLDFLTFIDKNKGAIAEFQEHIDKDKEIDESLHKFAPIYRRLTSVEGNSVDYLRQVIIIRNALDRALQEIGNIVGSHYSGNEVDLSFEMLSRVFAKFENNRSLLIPQEVYSKIANDLMNIFSYNNVYIYNIEPLKELFLTKASGGHVRILEEDVSERTSLAELIYAILAVRSQIKNIRKLLENVLKEEDSQSRSLNIWSQQIEKVQKGIEESGTNNERIDYLNRAYIYESYKSIINIKEIARYQSSKLNLIDSSLREVSIGSTAIFTSPEFKIASMVKNNSNIIFLISATGGISGDITASYDLNYLADSLRDRSGQTSFNPMQDEEISLCEQIRTTRQLQRRITANFFDRELSSFPNQHTEEVVRAFEKMTLKQFINSLKEKDRWFSSYKQQELQSFIRFLFYLFEDEHIQSAIAFTQTLRWVKEFIRFWQASKSDNFICEQSPHHSSIYTIGLHHSKYNTELKVKLILYETSFNSLYKTEGSNQTYLNELIEEEGQKIFFISAYQSAAKGLNPIVKKSNGREKDFDSLILLMDSYYTKMKPSNKKSVDSEKSTTLYHFAFMKSFVRFGDSTIEIKDFNKYLSQPEATEFREQQHSILLGKIVLQSIGRCERRDYPQQVTKIFINEETRRNLVGFYRYLESEEPQEIRKLSVNNYQVYESVQREEGKRGIGDYDDHVWNEIDAERHFQEFRTIMLNEIDLFHQDRNTFDIVKAWDALRDPIAFRDPSEYLKKLTASKLFPDDFINSLLYRKTEAANFIPYLAIEIEDGCKYQIISDSINGKSRYLYQKLLYPEYLTTISTGSDLEGNEIEVPIEASDRIFKLYRDLIPQPDIFKEFIPRPSFLYDVLRPSLTENFVEQWIKKVIFEDKEWKTIKDKYGFQQLTDFRKYSKLYEKFDLYYIKNNRLFCIDVKAWSQNSGNRLSAETLQKSQAKLQAIASEYPEFINPKGLLLNLHAKREMHRKHSPTLCSGSLIYFGDKMYPLESQSLRSFLFK